MFILCILTCRTVNIAGIFWKLLHFKIFSKTFHSPEVKASELERWDENCNVRSRMTLSTSYNTISFISISNLLNIYLVVPVESFLIMSVFYIRWNAAASYNATHIVEIWNRVYHRWFSSVAKKFTMLQNRLQFRRLKWWQQQMREQKLWKCKYLV